MVEINKTTSEISQILNGPLNWFLLILAIIAIVAVVMLVVKFMRNQNNSPEGSL